MGNRRADNDGLQTRPVTVHWPGLTLIRDTIVIVSLIYLFYRFSFFSDYDSLI